MIGKAPTASVVVVLGLLLAPVAAAGPAAAATGVPYTDPDAVGALGLCNQAGQQITSGSLNTTPFAWRAVSTVPAPSPYNNTGRTAVLVAYQPQQELPAGDWSGEQLTASSHYSNPTNPMAAATDGDGSLETFVQDYPPKWDGFIQLRMYLGTDNQPAYQEKYPVLNVKVTGSTWHAVGGSAVNCSSGTAESIETMLLPPSTTTTAPKAVAQPASTGVTTAGSAGSGGSSGGSGTSSAGAGGAGTGSNKGGSNTGAAASGGGSVTAAASSSSTPVGLIVGLIAAFALVLAAAWLLLSRRRRDGRPDKTTHPGPDGGAPGTGGPSGPDAEPQTAAGDRPAQEFDLATSQKAATKGE